MLKRQSQQYSKENQSDGVKEPGEYSLLLPGFLSCTFSTCPLAPSTPCPPGGNHGKRSSDSETTSVLLISFFPSFSIENQELTVGMEKEMATYSSILAWRIPWTEEPGGLWSMGSQRVVLDLVTKQLQTVTEDEAKCRKQTKLYRRIRK